MIEITENFKANVLSALNVARENYSGSNAAFAKKYGINESVYCELKKGNITKKMSAARWLNVGRMLDVSPDERRWNMARTDVFDVIEEQVLFCKEYGKSRMFVDECAIGKTYSALYLSRTLKNCFYVDCSQCKKANELIRVLARCIGLDAGGTIYDTKENIKYALKAMPKPLVIIDEAGDLKHEAFMVLKEFWNATDGCCGWYMMGADGLRTKIQYGKDRSKKEGYKELFSRFNSKYGSIVPTGKEDKMAFYRKLIGDVLSVNVSDPQLIGKIIRQCLATDSNGDETGLRRAESLLILNQQ
jgi:hypothetical protein